MVRQEQSAMFSQEQTIPQDNIQINELTKLNEELQSLPNTHPLGHDEICNFKTRVGKVIKRMDAPNKQRWFIVIKYKNMIQIKLVD